MQNSRPHFARGVLFALIGGVSWAFSGTCAEFLFETQHLSPALVTSVRCMISGVVFLHSCGHHRSRALSRSRQKQARVGCIRGQWSFRHGVLPVHVPHVHQLHRFGHYDRAFDGGLGLWSWATAVGQAIACHENVKEGVRPHSHACRRCAHCNEWRHFEFGYAVARPCVGLAFGCGPCCVQHHPR